MTKQQLPDGWDEERIRKVIAHYENQTDEEALAEDEAAWESEDGCLMHVPNELVPAVRSLIAHYESLRAG